MCKTNSFIDSIKLRPDEATNEDEETISEEECEDEIKKFLDSLYVRA